MTAAPRAPWLGAFVVAVATALAWHNSLHVPFLFDDGPAILQNRSIDRLGLDALFPPTNGSTVAGRPLLNLSFALNVAFGGRDVLGYHLLNLAIHIAAALALLGVIRRILLLPRLAPRFGRRALPIAFATSLLWAIHPLQTESVTYISQRAESCAGLLYLLTIYGFIRGCGDHAARRWYALAGVSCLLGMACKETVVTAPLLLLLLDATLIAGSVREALRRRAAVHATLFVLWLAPMLWLAAGGRGGTAGFHAGVPWTAYSLTQAEAIVHYVRLAFWPAPLVFDYGTPLATIAEAWMPLVAILAAVIASVVLLRLGWASGFLGASFLLLLAPSSSVLPIASQTIAEHRMYLALAVPVLAVVLLLERFASRWLLAATGGLALALGLATVARNSDYHSALSLWRDTVAKRPQNPRAHFNLGLELAAAGAPIRAAAEYRAAIALDDRNAEVHLALGELLLDGHEPVEALATMQRALELAPNNARAHVDAANALVALHRGAEALAEYETALRLRPDDAVAHLNVATGLVLTGREDEARAHLETAVRLRPDAADTHHQLANFLSDRDRVDEAQPHYEAALRLKPNQPELHTDYGAMLAQHGRVGEALPHFEAAAALDPHSAVTHANLATALFLMGQPARARAEAQQALHYDPANADAREVLARIPRI